MFLSFDCYGTLIDWEAGILGVLRPILERNGVELPDAEILEWYARLEGPAEAGPYRPYREVLATVMNGLGEALDFRPNAAERGALAASIADWPAFPDTVAALQRLATQYQLVILSNIDRDLVQGSLRHLKVAFHDVITAEEIRSYKPARKNFHYLRQKLRIGPDRPLIHVAQSLYHDIGPARALGIPHVWVNRRQGKTGPGATPATQVRAEREVGNLAELAEVLGV
ncbi:MAG: haloacid dehalogenase type II [Bacteroidota bacterium]